MTKETNVVAVDLGNSAVKICWESTDRSEPGIAGTPLVAFSFSIDEPGWTTRVVETVARSLPGSAIQWRIASVNAGELAALLNAIARRYPRDEIRQICHRDVPMKSSVDHPDRLGIDRLIGAWAGFCRFSGPLAVVDVGSAVTVDWVTGEGVFAGGAILPGLRLQADSLSAGTDALPSVHWRDMPKNLRLAGGAPAKNTEDAIRTGILIGLAGAVERLVDRYSRQEELLPPERTPTRTAILTGGDATLFSPHLDREYNVVPRLVCEGILRIPLA